MSKEYTRLFSSIGSVPSHGPFIFHDDFENILKWTKHYGGGDDIFELDPSMAYSKNQSLILKTRTTGAAIDDTIGAIINHYLLPSIKLNTSIHLRWPETAKIRSITFFYTFYDGINLHKPRVKYDINTPLAYYHDASDNPQAIPDSAFLLGQNVWHRFQLLVDLNTGKYIAFIIDNHHLNLSAYGIYTTTNPTAITLKLELSISAIQNLPCQIYLDDYLCYEL